MSLRLAPALVLRREVVQLLRVVDGVRVFDHHQPLRVLGVVLTGQGVPYELRFLGETEALRQRFGHLLRCVAIGQYQHMPYVSWVWGSIVHLAIVRQRRAVRTGRVRRSEAGCQWGVGCWTAMARKTAHDDPLAPVTIAVGQEDLLLDRAVQQVVAAARAADADTDVRDLTPDQLQPGTLAELTSPSLFAERKVVVVRAAQDLSADTIKDVKAYLGSPAEEITLVLLHAGAAKGKGLLDAARKAGAREIACPKMTKPADRLAFVRGEFRALGRSATPEACQSLVDAIGSDLRELASACSQLVADVEDMIDEAVVARYYTGRAEASSFTVADRAVEGRAAEALEALRWAISTGVAPVMITSALAQGVRAIGKLASAPRGARPGDLARELGMPPWKIDRVRQQMRGWSADGVATALRAVAAADAGVKGGGDDPAYALEKAVVAIARAARSR
ncbi:DNA polymerase III, delta subunit [Streptomyces sp. 2323.1]|nr:DNA polymerase III, delta subunit [Streptomyces sp. 2323.1]